jgi:tetratricopeptide (TPR) repeat protein
MRIIRQILLFITFLIIICNVQVKAITSIADSLEKELSQTKDEKARLILLNRLAKENASISFEKSIKYGNQALSLAQKLGDQVKEVDALLSIGEAYSNQNQFTEGYDYYTKAQKLSFKYGYKKGVAIALNAIGVNCYYQLKYDDALGYYYKSLAYSKLNKVKGEEGNALFNIGQVYKKKNEIPIAEKYYTQALQVFESINDNNGLAKVNNMFGIVQLEKGNYNKAIEYYEKALQFRQLSGDNRGSAILYNNIGNVLIKWGKYENALSNYQKALKIFEEISSQDGIAHCSNNIGLIYERFVRGDQYNQNIGYYNKALEFHQKALKIWEKLDNKFEIANSYSNIGNIYAKINNDSLVTQLGPDWEKMMIENRAKQIEKKFLPVIEYYQKSLSIREKIGYKAGIASCLSNLGKIFNTTKNFDQALSYLGRALKLDIELENKPEESDVLAAIGRTYYKLGNYSQALEYLNQSLDISIKNNLPEYTKNTYNLISNVYLAMGDYQKSLIAFKKYIIIQDSLVNENNMKQIAELQTQYETDKKDKEIQIFIKDAALKDAHLKQTRIFFTAGLILVLVVAVFLIRQNRERKRTNIELEAKNNLITEQKQEITDSIQYASRIQKAVMIVESQLKQLLPDSFIYFRPRDIVSGDFFWVNEKNGKIIVVAADCTGHGVPGAFMSMLGMSMFKSIVAENSEIHADEVLNDLRLRVIDSLHQTGKSGENKDGMDLALYILDLPNLTLEYAGANNPLYIVRNGELLETKADRMPIGIYEKSISPFTKHIISLQKGDMIYTFSDGYHDQFGGPENKKFMSGNLKKLFSRIYNNPVGKQHDILHTTITDWMKDTYQIDDILIIGVRV